MGWLIAAAAAFNLKKSLSFSTFSSHLSQHPKVAAVVLFQLYCKRTRELIFMLKQKSLFRYKSNNIYYIKPL